MEGERTTANFGLGLGRGDAKRGKERDLGRGAAYVAQRVDVRVQRPSPSPLYRKLYGRTCTVTISIPLPLPRSVRPLRPLLPSPLCSLISRVETDHVA